MDDQLYREFILEHWKNPQNYGVIDQADIDITDRNPLCGDEVHMTARVKDDMLIEVKFVGKGCAISQASASVLTELVTNVPLDHYRTLTQDQFLENLQISLTPARLKCALLAYSALQKALTNHP